MMFAKLLQLAADKKQIVGMCVHPPGPSGYCVEIWTGPSMGERSEWYERFPCNVPQMEALDSVAGIAERNLRLLWHRRGNSRAISETTPRHDRVEPEVKPRRCRAGRATRRFARPPKGDCPEPCDCPMMREIHRTA